MDCPKTTLEPPEAPRHRFHSPFSRPEDSLGYLLWHSMHDWQRQLDKQLAPLGLSHVQFILLATAARLADQGEAPTQARIAAASRFDAMLVSKVLRTIEARGLITRLGDPEDTRCKRIAPTERGWTILERAMTIVAAAHERHFGRLGEEGEALRRLLLKLLEIGPPH